MRQGLIGIGVIAALVMSLASCAEKKAEPLAAAVAPAAPPSEVTKPASAQTTNAAGIALIKDSEGLRLDAYQEAGQWFIGYGHAIAPKQGTRITEAEAEQLLKDDLGVCESTLHDLVKVPVSSNEYSAMASLCYSIGWQRFADSTVLKRINASDRPGAADGFLLWVKGVENGEKVTLPRLEARRQKEKALFLKPDAAPLPAS